MRVLVVSAHYPPNFISGGTLGPQRLARGLSAAGHEVSVYAGWIGDRPPLDTWTEADEVGIPVRWIVTTPWTNWWERRNYDNPDVAADFRLHLKEVQPDVVHVHPLQALGLGVVEACVEEGIHVIVTMHDFWWLCGRQFLSNRAMQLCSAVVSCGMCHCAVDREWLDRRNAQLFAVLQGVDLILAVSSSEAQILRANGIGIDPDGPQIVVDENGMPPLPNQGRPRLMQDPVVFLYTGGGELLKGARVVLDAARLLADVPGWTIHTYGMEAFLDAFDLDTPDGVVINPRFAPADADEVFEQADVLLLPSLVRESYSLVTREALARGMPVITSDTVGPEEVVEDDRNGLVLPAGDPTALAAAMRSIVEDHSLRTRLAAGARSPLTIRDIDDQISGLERHLEAVIAQPRRAARPAPKNRSVEKVLFLCGIDGAPLRYRARFAAEALALHGVRSWVRHYRSPDAAALAALADAVVVYRVPATHQVLGLIEATRTRGVPVFFDVDDLVFDPSVVPRIAAVSALGAAERDLYLQGVQRYRTTMESCDAFIGSTKMLVDHVREHVGLEVHRWPNGVGIGPARCSDTALGHPRSNGPLRVGYMSGTSTHDEDWAYIEAAVLGILDARPDVELWLGGLVTPSPAVDRFGERVKRLPLKPWWELPWVLRDLDVNLAPLAPESRFNEGKSAIKWLEAALAETVTVASPTLPFREVIDDGRTGQLAGSPEEFAQAIVGLLDDPLRRVRSGRLARRRALLELSPHLQGRRYLEILQSGVIGRTRPSSWEQPVSLDEPWADILLEDYVVPDPMLLAPIDPSDPTAPVVEPNSLLPGTPLGRVRDVARRIVRK